jgi:hypothetical protein
MGHRDGSGALESCTRPRRITPATSVAKAEDERKYMVVERLSHRNKVFASVCEETCSVS